MFIFHYAILQEIWQSNTTDYFNFSELWLRYSETLLQWHDVIWALTNCKVTPRVFTSTNAKNREDVDDIHRGLWGNSRWSWCAVLLGMSMSLLHKKNWNRPQTKTLSCYQIPQRRATLSLEHNRCNRCKGHRQNAKSRSISLRHICYNSLVLLYAWPLKNFNSRGKAKIWSWAR